MKRTVLAIGIAAFLTGPAFAGDPAAVDWSNVPTQDIKLFWPGQSTYQWLRSPAHKRADLQTKEGQACVACHKGEEDEIGNKLVGGHDLEPMPVEGKNGVIDLKFQVAYDKQDAYFRFQWKTLNDYAGTAHPYYRFNGKEWKAYGYPKLDEVVQDGEQPGIYEDRMSMMIDDGSVPMYETQGCWLTCHDGQRDSPDRPETADVKANALFAHLKKKDVRKYLPSTRTDVNASWDKGKTPEEIAKIKAAGGFLDLMQWRGHRSNPVGMSDDFYVLEYRNSDAGKNPFGSNSNKKTHTPKYMYDEKVFGMKSVTEADIRKMETILIREKNAVPFDPNAGWKEGDMIPKYIVSREDSKGSAKDNDRSMGVWKDGVWTVTWARKLGLTNPDDKVLKEGGVYSFGFATHDDNITTRGHHVSFPMTIGFGAKADIEATKLK
ncbi:MAG: hypothetical protein HOJ87_10875 [Rhodospirillaceae bacterium]|jgi:hypothetical protein|nr:hypothetical protein [Rhodospirillaceae bacterium]MBT5562836.1 hypothetical protein [Rhodospirillaceae bacterium]MBT6243239.1 hypothetical protein [Rhodospirillaceae bacterium]